MTLAQQAAVFVEAFESELLPRPDAIVRWTDSLIVDTPQPPAWLIDLSTLRSPHMIDFIDILKLQASSSLPLLLRWRIQIILSAHRASLLNLNDCLRALSHILLFEEDTRAKRHKLDNQLVDALVSWDCLEDLSKIPDSLRARFEILFPRYLNDANEISQLLNWNPLESVPHT